MKKIDKKLYEAVDCGDGESAKYLIMRGANVNANDGYDSILSIAGRSHKGNAKTVKLLIENGADIRGARSI